MTSLSPPPPLLGLLLACQWFMMGASTCIHLPDSG